MPKNKWKKINLGDILEDEQHSKLPTSSSGIEIKKNSWDKKEPKILTEAESDNDWRDNVRGPVPILSTEWWLNLILQNSPLVTDEYGKTLVRIPTFKLSEYDGDDCKKMVFKNLDGGRIECNVVQVPDNIVDLIRRYNLLQFFKQHDPKQLFKDWKTYFMNPKAEWVKDDDTSM
jgi:hypothetical protein